MASCLLDYSEVSVSAPTQRVPNGRETVVLASTIVFAARDDLGQVKTRNARAFQRGWTPPRFRRREGRLSKFFVNRLDVEC